jgi:predicted signal transduction protein with EAL and GGDEF domain
MGQVQRPWRRLGPTRATEADASPGPVDQAAFGLACGEAVATRAEGRVPGLIVLRVDRGGDVEPRALTGDDELAAVVHQRLAGVLPGDCLLGRLGDYEYGVLLPGSPDLDWATELCRRLVSMVGKPVFLTSQRLVQLSASCGLATISMLPEQATADDLFRAAHLAMGEARRAGRNRVEVCTGELIAMADERLAIGQDLRRALDEQGLAVSYQPLVDLRDEAVIGFEALVRWSHPVHGQVPPDEFVAVAEEFGMITELGHLVLSTATAQVQQWSAALEIPLMVHVNMSGGDGGAADVVETGAACLSLSGLPAKQLVLELTESAVAPDMESVREKLEALHGLGIRVAMDDFGVSRALVPHLQTLPVDILKVDRALIDDPDAPNADGLLHGVIALGQALGMEVYGEGIEDEPQRERLVLHGCTVGQGYLFAPPMTPGDAAAFLRNLTQAEAVVGG